MTSAASVYSKLSSDTISRSNIAPPPSWHIATYTFPAKPNFPLIHLCTIFEEISHRAPNYTLLVHQCYWFCSAFLERLRTFEPKIIVTEGRDSHRQGKYADRVPIVNPQRVENGYEEYRREQEENAKRQKEENNKLVRNAFLLAVNGERESRVAREKQAREMVTPFFRSANERRSAEIKELWSSAILEKRRDSESDVKRA